MPSNSAVHAGLKVSSVAVGTSSWTHASTRPFIGSTDVQLLTNPLHTLYLALLYVTYLELCRGNRNTCQPNRLLSNSGSLLCVIVISSVCATAIEYLNRWKDEWAQRFMGSSCCSGDRHNYFHGNNSAFSGGLLARNLVSSRHVPLSRKRSTELLDLDGHRI